MSEQILVDIRIGDKEESEDEDKGDEEGEQVDGEQRAEHIP